MNIIKIKCKKERVINKFKTFIYKSNNRNEEIQKQYSKEERINMIKNKLNDIEESVLSYK